MLESLATAFVPLALELGTYEDDYVDAYYGPAELKAAAEAKPRSKDALQTAAGRAVKTLDGILPGLREPLDITRARALRGSYEAAATRLAMLGGARFPFAVEAKRLFGVTPELKPLSYYDGLIEKLEHLVPGPGPLAERVDAFSDRYVVPGEKLQAVMDAAIAACRTRTLAWFDLPKDESFDLEFVTNKPWSGYNWYKGGYHSLIQVNTDLPFRVNRAVDLGCHEGYPGHHVLNILVEQTLVGQRKWREYEINPLYAPQSLIQEGSANYGISLAFPGEEQLAFERDVLFPLAGLDPKTAQAYWNVRQETDKLAAARLTIAQLYLDGKIDRAKAIALVQHYELTTAKRATQALDFIDHYRSYVINYRTGKDMVAAYVERGNADAKTRWARMRHVLADGVIPADLLGD